MMISTTEANFSLLSSTRYDKELLGVDWNTRVNGGQPSPFMLLPYHFDRLSDAAKKHGWADTLANFTIQELTRVCVDAVQLASSKYSDTPLKLRILLARNGEISVESAQTGVLRGCNEGLDPAPDAARTIYIDPESTSSSIFTSTKTTYRGSYNSARERLGLSPLPTPSSQHLDVLLHTPEGFVTETSIRNIAFHRGGKWVTPSAQSGCLPGVMRRLFLEQGRFVEGDVRIKDVILGETVLTVNGVEGCCMGRITSL